MEDGTGRTHTSVHTPGQPIFFRKAYSIKAKVGRATWFTKLKLDIVRKEYIKVKERELSKAWQSVSLNSLT